MCSQEDDCSCLLTSLTRKNERISQCIKCQSPPCVLIRKDDPALCKTCFINNCLHKINTVFGKYKISDKHHSKMALAFSGGQNSSALLQLLLKHNSSIVTTKRNKSITPKLFHLIESNDSQSNLELITNIMKNTGFEYHIISMNEISNSDQYKWKMTSSSFSSKQRFDDYLRLNLLVNCTRKLDCTCLILGECSNRVTVKYLLEIIEGRGNYSSIQTSLMDERYKDVTIIRPLRDFLAKELTLFAHFMELESITPNDPLTSIILKNPSINTLERLTQDFLASLQAGVVLENDTQVNCSFCHYPICNTESSDDPDKLATESMKYSFLLSNPSSCSEVTIPEENDNNLCSSCSLMFKELSSCT
ncbi:cytoplasmic tRNA 2-thiolation protein 2 [Schistosoma japonicum]|nr:cytoplasmic tRNA 2-thiolation protein 2 [Schistosoma japonicum]